MKSLAVAVAVIASFAAIQAQEVYKVGNGVSAPVVIRQINPGTRRKRLPQEFKASWPLKRSSSPTAACAT